MTNYLLYYLSIFHCLRHIWHDVSGDVSIHFMKWMVVIILKFCACALGSNPLHFESQPSALMLKYKTTQNLSLKTYSFNIHFTNIPFTRWSPPGLFPSDFATKTFYCFPTHPCVLHIAPISFLCDGTESRSAHLLKPVLLWYWYIPWNRWRVQ